MASPSAERLPETRRSFDGTATRGRHCYHGFQAEVAAGRCEHLTVIG
ncbi:hypothetical protein [Mycobacterium servetii]|uniref:Uncharacterized protein n=1 Tax=Mycobacterium servetii TaxID=3237418 RepID=A0ABV4C7G3_9MYCO